MSVISELKNTLAEGTNFGPKDNSRLPAFTLKVILLLIPGVFFGHYVDQFVNKLKQQETLGNNLLTYVFVQTMISISIIYTLSKINKPYTQEFQNTYAGLFFVSLFFGMQVNYVSNLKGSMLGM